jgi:sarcosine oxidase gamma subunit
VTELVRHRPLAGRDLVAGDVRMVVRSDLTAHLLTTRDAVEVGGAIPMGPCEHLFVGSEGDDGLARLAAVSGGGTVLFQDMTAAYVMIDLTGPDLAAKLGLAPLDPGTAGATRLADLRIVVDHRDGGLRLVVGASHAEYMWSWLLAKLEVS